MPGGYAAATSASARLDRFTTRCRLPASRIRARPQYMSQYVVVRASDLTDSTTSSNKRDRETLFICRAALAQDANGGDGSFHGPLSIDDCVQLTTQASLYRDLGGADVGFVGDAEYSGVQWIPSTKMRNAVAVTLEIFERNQRGDNNDGSSTKGRDERKQVQEWLRNYEYRQMLQETLQHHFLLCRNAVVQLPVPSGGGGSSGDRVVEFRVMSVYPEEEFVRVTPNTRVTLSASFDTDEEGDTIDLTVQHSLALKTGDSSKSKEVPKIGGLEKEQAALRDMILLPVENAELGERYGIEFPKGLLLCGPPGVGKTLLVRAVVHHCSTVVPLQLKIINGAEIMTSGVGDAETALRKIFADASEFARRTKGAGVIFIDELDTLCPKREASAATAHSRVVAQLLTLLDGVDKQARDHVVVVGATNLPNSIDAALRRPGRFDRELFIAPPSTEARKMIFQVNMQDMPICISTASSNRGSEDSTEMRKSAFFSTLACKSIGYVGADIAALCREALAVATTRQFVEMARDRELDEWWTEWKRQGSKPLYNASFSAVIAGNAWTANPIAIPLWFLAKQLNRNQQGGIVDDSDKTASYFSFLLKKGEQDKQDEGTTWSIDTESELQYAVLDPSHLGNTNKVREPVFEVVMADFEQAMQVVVASSLRGAIGFSKDFERLGWDAIGGQDDTKLALQQALEWPIKFPQTFTRLGVKPPRGILLYGPPGCSKSTIVRAAAHSSGATFLTISAAKVFSPFFGDAEAAVRQVFRDARAALPAIIFFDEIDVLVAKRQFDGSSDSSSGSSSAMRVMSTMLNEMDGVESADGLLVIGATNRPDCIDAALLRPGRFDRILYVDLPTEGDRLKILQIHSKPMQLANDVNLAAIAAKAQFFSGAELENVCREAALHSLRESIFAETVQMRHFEDALEGITPGSSPHSLRQYHEFAEKMGHLS